MPERSIESQRRSEILRPWELTEEDYVKQAILNVVNSFQMPDFENEMRASGGTSLSVGSSKVSIDRFKYNLGVLYSLVKEDLTDVKEWDNLMAFIGDEEKAPFEVFTKLFQGFKKGQLFKVRVPHLGSV